MAIRSCAARSIWLARGVRVDRSSGGGERENAPGRCTGGRAEEFSWTGGRVGEGLENRPRQHLLCSRAARKLSLRRNARDRNRLQYERLLPTCLYIYMYRYAGKSRKYIIIIIIMRALYMRNVFLRQWFSPDVREIARYCADVPNVIELQ